MRSDFWSTAPFPQLNDVLSSHQEQVGPMSPADLREAIERPAFCVGCEVEPALARGACWPTWKDSRGLYRYYSLP